MPGVLIVLNNYLHDVATAVLFSSALLMWVLVASAESCGPRGIRRLASAYPALTVFALGALAWIVVGGVPRTIFFTRYEWDPTLTPGIVPAIALKHVAMFAAVAGGAVLWRRARRIVSGAAA